VIVRMAWRSLTAHPVRAVVLGVGFGLGVGVMATLLGVGEVVLEQARTPALAGGGDLVVSGAIGRVTSARFMMNRLASLTETSGGAVLSPKRRAQLYLLNGDRIVPVRATGGIPSLERTLGDPETRDVAMWGDTAADAAWARSDYASALKEMDRFHPVPAITTYGDSWAEWLYFKGQSGNDQFYLTFLVGPSQPNGTRAAGVRLQLDRNGQITTFGEGAVVNDAEVLATAPDLRIGASRVRLDGLRYVISLDLPALIGERRTDSRQRAVGEIIVEAVPGRALAPLSLKGAAGWVSGYVVPVMSGPLSGTLQLPDGRLALEGLGYHDHNWGFWEGVSWRWGQVQHAGRSYVYGRVFPPATAADPERIPAFLVALDADGVVGYTSRVGIEETDDPATGQPTRIVVQGQRGGFRLRMELDVERVIVTRGGALAPGPDFLQLKATYRVTGEAGGEAVDFTAAGAAETFRGAPAAAAP
jgi:hypothetical protein